jgi:hypothetical protein
MATTYREADDVIRALVSKVMQQSHPELVKERVTIATTIASRESEEGDMVALRDRGLPAAAKMAVTSLQDRARGLADAKLLIDNYAWTRLSSQSKLALLDHELQHLMLVEIKPTKKNGWATGPKHDDLGRPCFKIRPHDWSLTGFQAVAERHAEHSIEARQFAAFRDEYGQLNFFVPSVLQIASGAKEAKKSHAFEITHRIKEGGLRPFSEALKTAIARNPGALEGAKVTDQRGNVLHNATIDLSNACARRHHKNCKYDKCQCDCEHPNRKGGSADD